MEPVSPANAARLFKELGSSRAVARALGITRPRATRLLQIAGVDLTPKTFEQLHPRPDNAQELFDECGSSRAFGLKHGLSQRHANKVLNFWKVRIAPSGREEFEHSGRKINVTRVWCTSVKKACTLFGAGHCKHCKDIHYAYKKKEE